MDVVSIYGLSTIRGCLLELRRGVGGWGVCEGVWVGGVVVFG
jgi:hypothetical protein